MEPSEKKKKMILRIFFHVWKNLSKEIFFCVEPTEIFFFPLMEPSEKKNCFQKNEKKNCVQPN